MPHGDLSDFGAIALLTAGFQQIFYPEMQFSEYPPLKACFDAKPTPELEFMIKVTGGLLVILGCALTTVRWNTINGKLTGLAFIGIAGFIAYITFQSDKESFILRPFYIHAAVFIIVGLHLMFNANPLLKVTTKQD
mmetsp:Transcript_7480/g.9499  ORF Transcript_7480/g.9499 Transcript_7480/m.9499 type:complete len:136 (-) Transcript_7480:1589-1996(-)